MWWRTCVCPSLFMINLFCTWIWRNHSCSSRGSGSSCANILLRNRPQSQFFYVTVRDGPEDLAGQNVRIWLEQKSGTIQLQCIRSQIRVGVVIWGNFCVFQLIVSVLYTTKHLYCHLLCFQKYQADYVSKKVISYLSDTSQDTLSVRRLDWDWAAI